MKLLHCNMLKVFHVFVFFRTVRSGFKDPPGKPTAQPLCGSHFFPHGIPEVCSQTSCFSTAGTCRSISFCSGYFAYISCSWLGFLECVLVFLGIFLLVAIRGAAWSVSGEHVQSGPSTAPDGPYTLGHTLLPKGAVATCMETGCRWTIQLVILNEAVLREQSQTNTRKS